MQAAVAMTARCRYKLPGALAAAVLAAALASGCGSGAAQVDPVAQAAQTTTHAGGVHMSFTLGMRVQSSGGGQLQLTGGGQGVFNFAAREGQLELSVGGLPAAARAALHGGTLAIDELYKGGALYMRSPILEGRLPGGARWLKLDLTRVDQALGLDPSALTSGGANPAQYLQYLTSAGASVREVGHDTLEGVPTTHYDATIDLLKAAEAQPGADRARVRAAFARIAAEMGTRELPVQVWIDAHNLVRMLAMQLAMHAGTGDATMSFTARYSDFGPTPSFAAPAGSEVFDITGSALGSLAGVP